MAESLNGVPTSLILLSEHIIMGNLVPKPKPQNARPHSLVSIVQEDGKAMITNNLDPTGLQLEYKVSHEQCQANFRGNIDSIPDELLSSIIQHLSWRNRVQVELVSRRWRRVALTHVWSDVKHLATSDYIPQSKWHRPYLSAAEASEILDRCGHHAISLRLDGVAGLNTNDLVEKCTGLRRIGFICMKIDGGIVDYIPRGEAASENFRNIRSFQLHQYPIPPATHDYLTVFTNLAYLCIQLTPENLASFSSALGRLPQVRALELKAPFNVVEHTFWGEAVRSIAANRPELQHLALDWWLLAGVNNALLLQLERLVSVKVRAVDKNMDWSWLVANNGQLEHVVVDTPSKAAETFETMCRTIEKCSVCPLQLN